MKLIIFYWLYRVVIDIMFMISSDFWFFISQIIFQAILWICDKVGLCNIKARFHYGKIIVCCICFYYLCSNHIINFVSLLQTHCRGNRTFNFHKYMNRALEEDFKKVVGIRYLFLPSFYNYHNLHRQLIDLVFFVDLQCKVIDSFLSLIYNFMLMFAVGIFGSLWSYFCCLISMVRYKTWHFCSVSQQFCCMLTIFSTLSIMVIITCNNALKTALKPVQFNQLNQELPV